MAIHTNFGAITAWWKVFHSSKCQWNEYFRCGIAVVQCKIEITSHLRVAVICQTIIQSFAINYRISGNLYVAKFFANFANSGKSQNFHSRHFTMWVWPRMRMSFCLSAINFLPLSRESFARLITDKEPAAVRSTCTSARTPLTHKLKAACSWLSFFSCVSQCFLQIRIPNILVNVETMNTELYTESFHFKYHYRHM